MKKMGKTLAVLLVAVFMLAGLPLGTQAAGLQAGVPALTVSSSSNVGTLVGFAGQQWYVIGYNGTGVYSQANTATLLFTSSANTYGYSKFRDQQSTDPGGYQQWTTASGGDDNWYAGSFTVPSDYADSTLQRAMAALAANTTSFPANEMAYVNARDLTSSDGIGGASISGQKLWALSLAEFDTINNNTVRAYPNDWWLRSPYDGGESDFGEAAGSNPFINLVSNFRAIRPALNLNLSSVLFTSAAAGGKSDATAGGNLVGATAPTGAVKFTIEDPYHASNNPNGQALTVIATTAQSTQSSTSLAFSYSGATTGTNQYVSCVLVDSSNVVKYYGKLANSSSAASGTLSIPLTTGTAVADGTYTLKVFSEQANGDNYTDFCSTPVTATVAVSGGVGTVSYFGGTVVPDPTPTLTATPASLPFGNQQVGTTSAARTVTVSGADLSGNISYNITGTGAAVFTASQGSWNAASGGTLNITFSPTAAQSYSATLTISSSGATNKTVALSGTGAPVSDNTPPVLTAGSASRTGTTDATVKFSSGEAGSYYYQLDGAAPTAASLVAAGTNQTTMAAAENTITLNSLAAGPHTLYVAAADAAGNVSGLLTFTIPAWTPGGDNTAPALTTGSAVRISDIQATVSFTANEAGSYHYLVQEVAATAPTTAQVQGSANAGTMQAGANSFAPPPLADDAAKAVYIVAEDAAGNLSNMLTVIIPPDHTATQTPGSLGKGENALFTFKGEYVYLAGVSLTHQNGTVYSFGMAQTGGKTVLTHGTATAGDVVPGSVKVTLYAAWLDTLPAGSYTLSVAFNDGVVQSRGDAGFTLTREQQGATIQEPTTPTGGSPQTGDSSNLGLWVALLAASIAVLGGGVWLLARRRRRTQR